MDRHGEAVESQLDATYFDTADARLARHHITLRRRTGGDDAGWHLKLPAGQDERTEVRRPLGRATRTVPVALVREVRAIVRDRRLVPIAVLHTVRIERRLLDGDGNTLATIADDTVREELQWLGQALGGARDAEVLHWRLRDLVAGQLDELVLGPVRRRVDLEMGRRHKAALADLAAKLDGERYLRLLDALDDLVNDPPLTARAGKPAHGQLPVMVGA